MKTTKSLTDYDMNSMVCQIQSSSQEEGEMELTETILREFDAYIKQIAGKIIIDAMDKADIEQHLRIKLLYAIEFWPQKGVFRHYAITTLSNALKDLMRKKHISIEPYEDNLQLSTLDDTYHKAQYEAQEKLNNLKYFLYHKHRKLAYAIHELQNGHDATSVALLFGFRNKTRLIKELRKWGKILSEGKIDL